jgi:23S rRNA pseudouridine1911/1915/1917 synthase
VVAPVSLIVPELKAQERLDRFLVECVAEAESGSALEGLSRARIQKLIEQGEISVDGAPSRAAYKLKPGDRVVVRLPRPEPLDLVPEEMPLEVLYEDKHLVVLNKPAGLSVHPGAGRKTGTLVHALLAHCQDLSGIGGRERPGIVHRLDKDTSGVVVVAKHDRAHIGLTAQFADRQVVKTYLAWVLGTPQPLSATIDTRIGRHPTDRVRFTTRVRHGRRAITHYEVVATKGGVAKLLIDLGTGRTHQIRVHLSERGYPVLGDPTYGGRHWGRISDARLLEFAKQLDRQALHAWRLQLTHPVTGAVMTFEAPIPADLEPLLRFVG